MNFRIVLHFLRMYYIILLSFVDVRIREDRSKYIMKYILLYLLKKNLNKTLVSWFIPVGNAIMMDSIKPSIKIISNNTYPSENLEIVSILYSRINFLS